MNEATWKAEFSGFAQVHSHDHSEHFLTYNLSTRECNVPLIADMLQHLAVHKPAEKPEESKTAKRKAERKVKQTEAQGKIAELPPMLENQCRSIEQISGPLHIIGIRIAKALGKTFEGNEPWKIGFGSDICRRLCQTAGGEGNSSLFIFGGGVLLNAIDIIASSSCFDLNLKIYVSEPDNALAKRFLATTSDDIYDTASARSFQISNLEKVFVVDDRNQMTRTSIYLEQENLDVMFHSFNSFDVDTVFMSKSSQTSAIEQLKRMYLALSSPTVKHIVMHESALILLNKYCVILPVALATDSFKVIHHIPTASKGKKLKIAQDSSARIYTFERESMLAQHDGFFLLMLGHFISVFAENQWNLAYGVGKKILISDDSFENTFPRYLFHYPSSPSINSYILS